MRHRRRVLRRELAQAGTPCRPAQRFHRVRASRAGGQPVTGEERDRLYAEQATRYPQFAGYEQRTTRRIPVVALTRRG